MQKLLVEFQNTPEDAPQVLCSVSGALNRDKSLSVCLAQYWLITTPMRTNTLARVDRC
ncbi:hypothetical protein IPdc08_00510 [archaeon]|nr:hypothetical protein IPdc08_00510 [archaeon]